MNYLSCKPEFTVMLIPHKLIMQLKIDENIL